jgi:presenilin-like A22 family membrane protease
MGALFVIVWVIAIIIAPIYSQTQSEAMGGRETIENPSFAFFYLGIILVFTFVILWIAKRKKEKFIKGLILAAIFMTMVYLFIPLTIAIMYPSEGDGWGFTDTNSTVVVLNAGDIDDDGVIEIVAGCSDNRIRIYESENHTLEWESEAFLANISQIQIGDVDNDGIMDIAVLSDGITVFNGSDKSEKWSLSFANFTTMTLGDWVFNTTVNLIAGTDDTTVILFVSDMIYYEFDLSGILNNISFLDTTDDERIIASDDSTIVLFNTTNTDVEAELEITELEEIRALTVYRDPQGEDYILAADEDRVYLYNLTSEKHQRRGPEFDDIQELHLEFYSISDFDDSIADVLAVSDRTVYISPDLLKDDKGYYFLRFRYDIYSFLSTDLDGDGSKEMILGKENGYKYTSIEFGGEINYLLPIIISITIALSLTYIVHKYPEWYVVDTVGLVMGIGATVILGVTFAILPALVLLLILAIYDAISVYKTKHMISLADSVIDLNLPVLLVIPKKWSYSFRKEKPRLKEQLESGAEREAMFMGLGDIVIPSLLVVSALSFLPSSEGGLGIANNLLVSIGTMIGILIGFTVLMRFVMKGNPQAGLPLLNSGAIGGYIITYLLVFGDFGFGFNLNFL